MVKEDLPLLSSVGPPCKMIFISVAPWILQAVLMCTDSQPFLPTSGILRLALISDGKSFFWLIAYHLLVLLLPLWKGSQRFVCLPVALVENEPWIKMWNPDLRDSGWECVFVCVFVSLYVSVCSGFTGVLELACNNLLSTSFSTSVFSGIVSWNWPWWEFLAHGNWQVLQINPISPIPDLVVKHVLAHYLVVPESSNTYLVSPQII